MKRILLTGFLFTAGLGVYGEANAYCTLSSGFTTVDISMAVDVLLFDQVTQLEKY